MKFVIEIVEIEKCPDDWTTKANWPGEGIYRVKEETNIYAVHSWGVSFIGNDEPFTKTPYIQPEEQVSESLLLKAIAAASRAENLR